MSDDFLGADWSANSQHLTAFIHKLTQGFMESMEQLSRQQFDAPWRGTAPTRSGVRTAPRTGQRRTH